MKAPFTLVAIIAAAGCTGVVEVEGGGTKGGSGIGGDNTVVCVQGAAPPTTRVRRLTKVEIQASASAMLGIDATAALANLDADSPASSSFSNSDGLVVSDSFGNGLNLAAETIGTAFKATVTPAAYGATCFSSESAAATCAESFIRSVGKKAFRRDITAENVAGLKTVYEAGRETGTDGNVGDRFATGLSWVARAMVQSPDFLYLTEVGDPAIANGGKTNLTSDEIAAALSYSIVGLPPDDQLVAAAAAGQLATAEVRGAQATRLIAANPDAWKGQMRMFVPQWLGINFARPEWSKDTDALPLFSQSVKDALQTETNMLIDDWATSADGARVGTLLTSPTAFVNSVTASLYGVSVTGSAFQKTALDPTQRAGILTLGGFLGSTSHVADTSPVMRGKAIMQKFLCSSPPPPPPNVPPLPPVDQSAPTTTRARYEAHLADAACSGCHGTFEPMGNAFEMFDALGGFRTKENGFPVDSSGVLVGASGGDKPVANALELVRLLADSPQTHQCVAQQIFRFTIGRAEVPYDNCMLVEAAKGLGSGASDLREIVIRIVSSDSFVVRTVNKE